MMDDGPVQSSQGNVKACECGCGAPVAPDKRFASRACIAIHAQKFRGPSRPKHAIEAPESLDAVKEGLANGPRSGDASLETVIEVLRYLRALPRDVRNKALELLDSIENSTET